MKTKLLVGTLATLGLGMLSLVSAHPHGSVTSGVNTAQCTYKKFRVTSYYSPVEGQDFYYRSNVQDEWTLNGRGIAGASGAPVFNGMIAAPSSYAFGTKIYFPGWGIGQVEDRGGAIVHKGERNQQYDRIDIWAGKGEEGLERALSFGVQYLDAYICPKGAIPQKIGFDYDRFPSYSDFFERMLWILALEPGREDKFVKSLQRYLVKLGYLDSSSTTGKYGRLTKAAVCAFQQRTMGLPSSHEACGTFGPQTRETMRDLVKRKRITLSPLSTTTATAGVVKVAPVLSQEQLSSLSVQQQFHHQLFTVGEFANYTFNQPLIKGQATKEARILQRKLAWLGYYKKQEVTGVYDTYTIQAIYAFQLDKGIVNGTEDPNVFGYMGPGTRRVLNGL